MDFNQFLSDFIYSEKTTNSKIAEKLEVPAATISHLLSGRNKPSLDFIQKLIKTYPSLDLYKVLNLEEVKNKGSKKSISSAQNDPTLFQQINKSNKKVQKVVLFYEDNTFEEYNLNK